MDSKKIYWGIRDESEIPKIPVVMDKTHKVVVGSFGSGGSGRPSPENLQRSWKISKSW